MTPSHVTDESARVEGVQADTDTAQAVVGEASPPPVSFVLALAIPAWLVLIYMLQRVFGGRWIDGPPPGG